MLRGTQGVDVDDHQAAYQHKAVVLDQPSQGTGVTCKAKGLRVTIGL